VSATKCKIKNIPFDEKSQRDFLFIRKEERRKFLKNFFKKIVKEANVFLNNRLSKAFMYKVCELKMQM
jgi:hypothetical protein